MLAIWAQGLGVRFWCGISVKSLGVGARGLGHTIRILVISTMTTLSAARTANLTSVTFSK